MSKVCGKLTAAAPSATLLSRWLAVDHEAGRSRSAAPPTSTAYWRRCLQRRCGTGERRTPACRRVRAAARGVCALTTLGDARGSDLTERSPPRALPRLSCTQSLERPRAVPRRRRAQASSSCNLRAICVARHRQILPANELDRHGVLAAQSHFQRCPRQESNLRHTV
jgi:hypothetical protein